MITQPATLQFFSMLPIALSYITIQPLLRLQMFAYAYVLSQRPSTALNEKEEKPAAMGAEHFFPFVNELKNTL
eukprot:CAMPEP_0171298982 /NCGR_PEP_ID=MMETSP0816-20121228/7761_1 /TAXON_ID=420281 /ORGANISM="Proboscia inermis, Strain CCAP1064/1" /LENGTH=72 /DNA_ID=CAMNT_0011774401 /DNA_START=88 /DNA_END=306 /DNA_ORIENTATION=+